MVRNLKHLLELMVAQMQLLILKMERSHKEIGLLKFNKYKNINIFNND